MATIKGQRSVTRSASELQFQMHHRLVRSTQPLLSPQAVSHTCKHAEVIELREGCLKSL